MVQKMNICAAVKVPYRVRGPRLDKSVGYGMVGNIILQWTSVTFWELKECLIEHL